MSQLHNLEEEYKAISAAWNGKDERGIFEGEPIVWEERLEWLEQEISEILREQWDDHNSEWLKEIYAEWQGGIY